MKKTIISSAIALIITGSAFAQPVSDRAVVPIGVTLQQILRINVINGGNIEFVFNDIDDYKEGINNVNGGAAVAGVGGFYTTDVQIASSTDWSLDMGAEDATFLGTDDPGNTMTLDNVGFTCDWTGANTCCGAALDVDDVTGTVYADCITALGAPGLSNALLQFTGNLTALLFIGGATGNGGDVADNSFSIQWEAGTHDVTWGLPTYVNSVLNPMNTNSLLDQSLTPDRYVTNVFFELTSTL